MLDVIRTLFRTSFLNLSGKKKLLLRIAGLAAVGGLAAKGYGLATDSGPVSGVDWSHLSLTSGLGCIAGFIIGAAIRIFFKVTLALGLAFVALGFLLSWLGWLELPWDSFGQASKEIGLAIERQTRALQDFLSGYLPAGGASAVGLGSGLTQKPEFDDDTD